MNPRRRTRAFSLFLIMLVALVCTISLQGSAQSKSKPPVVKLVLRDTIQPVSAAYLARGLRHAADQHAQAVLVELSTPGGLLDSTRTMVASIEHSSVPVIVFVEPTGSRAASAGFFILESSDVAAMAPGTNTGASHPILEGRQMDPILKQKIENDAAAFLRSVVTHRNRNAQAAEDAVRQSKSYTDKEALDLHLIDRVAPSDAALLDALDGTTITRFDGSTVVLHTRNATVDTLLPNTRERILGSLMDPNLAVILFIVGALLIYLEFNVPGTIVPGSIGTLLVLLSMFALNLLPIEYTAVALLLGALVLFLLEVKFSSHGILGLAGIVCLIFGLLTLVNGPIPELRVRLSTAIAAGIAFGLITLFLTAIAVKARRNKVQIGSEAMLGTIAVAQTALAPVGQIMLRGELWQAKSNVPVAAGDRVRVQSRDGLLLTVERVD
ncbi:MAG TPA: nodulation protein NfeD [Acidobacteriaceae bacterium]|jgi:membrane-bound serine protease (ClpP class)|nr:nodulation protein NfeD [Acidobacteriaceae bacterium]